jgi:hypothetical protein
LEFTEVPPMPSSAASTASGDFAQINHEKASFQFGFRRQALKKKVNRSTGALRCELPDKFMAIAQKRRRRVMYEILQSQIEAATPPLQPATARILASSQAA